MNEQSVDTKTITFVFSPERAEALRQAAGETAGQIVVKLFDATNPDDREEFARLTKEADIRLRNLGLLDADGYLRSIRTADQINTNIIEPAARKGMALVAIQHSSPDISPFWNRVNEIAPRQSN